MIEGLLTRAALVSDIELVDGYPSSYMSSALRLHRWVRGDWQILSFLFSNKLSAICRWKILVVFVTNHYMLILAQKNVHIKRFFN